MTVTNETAGVVRIGDGTTTNFSFPFKALYANTVFVAKIVSTSVIELVATTAYTVTLNLSGNGGELIFNTAPALNVQYYIFRESPFTQEVGLSSQQRYDPKVSVRVWDMLTLLVQEVNAKVARAVLTSPGVSSAAFITDLFGALLGAQTAQTAAQVAAVDAQAYAVAASASAAAALAKQNTMIRARGPWLTGTSYTPSDIVYYFGTQYEVVTAHTSGVFATDLAAGRLRIFLLKGEAGSGTGDMLKANIGSEYASNAGVFRANLGLGIGRDLAALIPGEVIFLLTNVVPDRYLQLAGQTLLRLEYDKLFAAVGAFCGAGNGTTTFVLPDMRNLFPRASGGGASLFNSARVIGSIQDDAMQDHLHGLNSGGGGSLRILGTQTARVGGLESIGSPWGEGFTYRGAGGGRHVSSPSNVDGTVGGIRTAAETRPKNLALMACICIGPAATVIVIPVGPTLVTRVSVFPGFPVLEDTTLIASPGQYTGAVTRTYSWRTNGIERSTSDFYIPPVTTYRGQELTLVETAVEFNNPTPTITTISLGLIYGVPTSVAGSLEFNVTADAVAGALDLTPTASAVVFNVDGPDHTQLESGVLMTWAAGDLVVVNLHGRKTANNTVAVSVTSLTVGPAGRSFGTGIALTERGLTNAAGTVKSVYGMYAVRMATAGSGYLQVVWNMGTAGAVAMENTAAHYWSVPNTHATTPFLEYINGSQTATNTTTIVLAGAPARVGELLIGGFHTQGGGIGFAAAADGGAISAQGFTDPSGTGVHVSFAYAYNLADSADVTATTHKIAVTYTPASSSYGAAIRVQPA